MERRFLAKKIEKKKKVKNDNNNNKKSQTASLITNNTIGGINCHEKKISPIPEKSNQNKMEELEAENYVCYGVF